MVRELEYRCVPFCLISESLFSYLETMPLLTKLIMHVGMPQTVHSLLILR